MLRSSTTGWQLAHPPALSVAFCAPLKHGAISTLCTPDTDAASCLVLTRTQKRIPGGLARTCSEFAGQMLERPEKVVTSLMRSSGMPRTSLSSDTLAHCPAWLLSLCSLTRLVSSTSAWSTCHHTGATMKTCLRGNVGMAGAADTQALQQEGQQADGARKFAVPK